MACDNFYLTVVIIVIGPVQVVLLFINQNITDILTDRQRNNFWGNVTTFGVTSLYMPSNVQISMI